MNVQESWEQLHKAVTETNEAIGTTGRFTAYLGKPGGGSPVADASRRRIYYSTAQGDYGEAILDAGSGVPLQAVSALNGRAVWLAYPPGESRDGGVPHVIGLAPEGMLIANGQTPQEQIMNASIFPSAEQLTLLRASPTNPPTTSLQVQGEWIFRNPATGALNDLPTSTADAKSLMDALTVGQHQLVALCADPTQTDDASKLLYVSSTAITAAGALPARAEFSIEHILALPLGLYVPIIAVYLYYGQPKLEEADLYRQFPLRPLYQTVIAANYQTLQVDGTAQTTRPILDLEAGANVTLTPTDDGPGTRSKVVVAATPGTGSGATPSVCEGRLTLESGVPISTTDQTAKTTLYFTPYKGSYIGTYSGSAWSVSTFTEKSLDISAYTASKNYDIFIVDGTLALEGLIWTDDATRATALALQDGIHVKNGDATRRYLGTIRITASTGQCEDSLLSRYIWNYYNQRLRVLRVLEATASWTYNSTTWRQVRAQTANRVTYVCGLSEDVVKTVAVLHISAAAGKAGTTGIGIDSTSTNSAQIFTEVGTIAVDTSQAYYEGYPGIGYHALNWLEVARAGTPTFDGAYANGVASGLKAEIVA